ncbi:MAG: hypothetical protein CFH41_00916 [Alphaproteobacteria bacterium MarineAlpha11_Bin1]|nr:MAG: hypothetical protein CFH41_00916 [Alphaproteobacteria bacterium MarineAlpha11_Bin1]
MGFMRVKRTCLFSIILLSESLLGPPIAIAENPNYSTEVFKFKSVSRGKERPVIAQIWVPTNSKGPHPVIVTQHGAGRDGLIFADGEGRTDEYSSRIIKNGIERGFVVAALDAFFENDIQPRDKKKFPNAYRYALDLKKILASDIRFDNGNIFYTGFSFGAAQVGKSFDIQYASDAKPWRAVAAAEPGCNAFPEPIKATFPVLIIKGSESHYYLEPCQHFIKMLRKAGNLVTFLLIKGANHFFSTDGRITRGVAVNGCRFNPLIRMQIGGWRFADGSKATRRLFIDKCFTNEGGSGRNREHLNKVIREVINFFESNRS